jgi:hypothetical protein
VVSLTIARWPFEVSNYLTRPCYLHHTVGRHYAGPAAAIGTTAAYRIQR